MKKIAEFIICLAALCLSLSTVCFASDYMETGRFDTTVEIYQNNSFRITEEIDVDFLESRHGIYRYIPYEFYVTREINGTVRKDKCTVKIKDIDVIGAKFETYIENKNTVIRIGSEDETVFGEKKYVISYTVMCKDDNIAEMDDFYWNVIPHDWETPIKSSKIKITFPKSADLSNASVLSGLYGEIKKDAFSLEISENEILAFSQRELSRGEGVTVRAELPDEYFVGEEQNKTLYGIIFAFALASLAAVMLLKLLFGRKKRIIPVVNFYPPEDMTSADIGFVIDGVSDTKDIVSLMIYWANKGYLSLKELDNDTVSIKKLCDIDENAKSYEKNLFAALFKNRDEVTTKELSKHFYTSIKLAQSSVACYYNLTPKRRIFKTSSQTAGFFAMLLTLVPMAAAIIIGCIIKIMAPEFPAVAVIGAIITFAALLLRYFFNIKSNALSSVAKAVLNVLSIMLVLFAAIGQGAVIYFAFGYKTAAAVCTAATLICAFVSTQMRTHTEYGRKLTGDILGFKQFIKTAELDRIKVLAQNDPKYFYSVLPFAYVMGLTDVWAKKFEKIAVVQPDWYVSQTPMSTFNSFMFMRSLNHCMNTMTTNMISVPASSSGGSFGSGSFSGGGFSGGGGGGGGGGSW